MIRSMAGMLLGILVAGCVDGNLPAKIEVQQVKVEVPVKRELPKELVECDYKGPLPKWHPVDGKPGWAALDAEGQRFARDMLVTVMGCKAALIVWGTAD